MNSANAQAIYSTIETKLSQPEFKPRALFERFNIEVLVTTDAATDRLQYHQTIHDSGWSGRILPTFRPDAVVNIDNENRGKHIEHLSYVSGVLVTDFRSFTWALEQRCIFFKSMGATATDHAALTA